MRKNNYLISILFIISFICVSTVGNSEPQYIQDINESDIVPYIISTYYLKSIDDKEIVLFMDINSNKELIQKEYLYSDIVIGDLSLTPIISNPFPELMDINVNFDSVYFYSSNKYNQIQPNFCNTEIIRYYESLKEAEDEISPDNLLDSKFDKDLVIDNIFIPRTKERIVDYLNTVTNREGENCFDYLTQNKIINGYNILLKVKINTKQQTIVEDNNYSFSIDFEPEFNNLVKPITFILNFNSEATRISLDYLNENNSDLTSIDFSRTAAKYLNTPYVFAGRNRAYIRNFGNLKEGIDCVGLLYVSFRDMGYIDDSMRCVELFRNGWGIADFIEKNKGHISGRVGVIRNESELRYLRSGDLLFLTTKAGLFGHAGIYVGTEPNCYKFIHASSVGRKVMYDCFNGKLSNSSNTAFRYPLYFTRVTRVNTQNIDCSGNLISTTNGRANWSSTDYGNPPPARLTADLG